MYETFCPNKLEFVSKENVKNLDIKYLREIYINIFYLRGLSTIVSIIIKLQICDHLK